MERLNLVQDYQIEALVELFIRQSFEHLDKNDENLLRDWSCATLFLEVIVHNVNLAHRKQVVNKEELEDHVLLSTLRLVKNLLA